MFCIPFIGCLNTDFGRVRPTLRSDDMHSWMGPAVTERLRRAGIGHFRLTDDERMLRDLAYPLIEPPYERQRWYSVLNRIRHRPASSCRTGGSTTRPPTRQRCSRIRRARPRPITARLIDDIRNDIVRIRPIRDGGASGRPTWTSSATRACAMSPI